MKLILFPDNMLRERMPDFDFDTPLFDPKQLEQDMVNFMLENNAIGLAANQVGIKTRMFVMGHKSNPDLCKGFFNPMVISSTNNILDLEEGCLSFPNIFVKIKRPSAIQAKWQNSSGEWEEGTFNGYDCKCFLHELDHLEGIVYKDRISNLKWNLAIKRKN